MSSHRGRVTVAVDEEEDGGVAQAGFSLTAGSQLFFGGKTPVKGTLLETITSRLAVYVFPSVSSRLSRRRRRWRVLKPLRRLSGLHATA